MRRRERTQSLVVAVICLCASAPPVGSFAAQHNALGALLAAGAHSLPPGSQTRVSSQGQARTGPAVGAGFDPLPKQSSGHVLPPASPAPRTVAYTFVPFNNTLEPGRFLPAVPGSLAGGVFDPATQSILVGDSAGGSVFALNASSGVGSAAWATAANPSGDFPAPVALAFDPSRNVVYAANANNGNVSVFNASTGRLLKSIGVGCGPEAIAYDASDSRLFVANFCSANVTVINASSWTALPLSASVGGHPTSVLWDPGNGEIYVTCVDTEEVIALNPTTGAAVHHFLLGGSPPAVDVYPISLAYDPNNGRVYVANEDSRNVSVINGSTDQFVGSGVNLGASPLSLLFDPADSEILVSSRASIESINASSNNLTSAVAPTGLNPVSMVYDSADGLVYSVNAASNSLTAVYASNLSVRQSRIAMLFPMLQSAYDPQNGELYVASVDPSFGCIATGSVLAIAPGPLIHLEASIPVGYGPEAVGVDVSSSRLFVPNYCSSTVSVIDARTDVPLNKSLVTGPGPIAAAPIPEAGQLVVANGGSNNVTVFNTTSLSVVSANISVGPAPDAIGVDPRSGLVFVASFASANLTVINSTTWAPQGNNVPTGAGPESVIFNPANGDIYVADSGADSVEVVNGTTGAVISPAIPVGAGPVALCLDPASDSVYVADAVAGSVSVIDAVTNQVVGQPIKVGPDPQGLAYDAADGAIFVDDFQAGAIYVIASAPSVTSIVATPNPGEVGVPLTMVTSIVNASLPVNVTYSGLPPGCMPLDTLFLSCEPAVAGSYTVGVFVVDGRNLSAAGTMDLLVEPLVEVTGVRVQPALTELGASVQISVETTGGLGGVALSYAGLPPGCTPGGAAQFTCSPSAPGSFYFTVTAVDMAGASSIGSAAFTILPPPEVLAFVPSDNAVQVGASLSLSVNVTGGVEPYTYSYASLPPGCLSQNRSVISCRPAVPGVYLPRVTVQDADGYVAGAQTNVTVSPESPLPLAAVLDASPGNLSVGEELRVTALVSGGTGRFTYSYSGLPPGCLPENVSEFACTPTGPGTFTVAVLARDSAGQSATAQTVVLVNASGAGSQEGVVIGLAGIAAIATVSVAAGLVAGWFVGERRARKHAPMNSAS